MASLTKMWRELQHKQTVYTVFTNFYIFYSETNTHIIIVKLENIEKSMYRFLSENCVLLIKNIYNVMTISRLYTIKTTARAVFLIIVSHHCLSETCL